MFKTKNTVRGKIARRVVAALVITISLLSAVILIFMSRQIMKEEQQELSLQTDICATYIYEWSETMSEVVRGVVASEESMGYVDEEFTYRLINKALKDYPNLMNVYVASEEGDMYMGGGVEFPDDMDVRGRVWYQQAKETGGMVIINPYVSATSPDLMHVTIAAPVFVNNQIIGVVGVDAEITMVVDYVSTATQKENAYAFLIDSDGNIVAHPYDKYNPTIEEMVHVSDAMPEVYEMLESGSEEIFDGVDYAGNKMVYAIEEVGDTGWHVAVAYLKNAYLKKVFRGIGMCLFVAVICIIISSGDIAVSIKKILTPLDSVNPAMDNILKGNFHGMIEFNAGDDEIGQIQNKMADMVLQLSEIIEKQKAVLSEMARGNLNVDDMDALPGELNEISASVNSIKAAFNDIINDIQFSAINLQSFAMGINETSDLEEMKAVFEELSAEANALMEKTSRFVTGATAPIEYNI